MRGHLINLMNVKRSLFVHYFFKKEREVTVYSASRNSAEKEGFEPPDLLQSTVFKTAAFDRSAISPVCRFHYLIASANIRTFFGYANLFLEKKHLFSTLIFKGFIFYALDKK